MSSDLRTKSFPGYLQWALVQRAKCTPRFYKSREASTGPLIMDEAGKQGILPLHTLRRLRRKVMGRYS